jgi:SAM-dependent methyltransferase
MRGVIMDREDWDRRYGGKELVWTAEPNRFLVREVEGLPTGRALDLAAGEGRNAVWLAEQGFEVDAVDFSAVAVEKGARLAADRGVRVSWLVEDVLAWTPPEAAYDLVVVLYLHLPQQELRGVLERAAAAVAPGGSFLLVGHDVSNLEHGVGGPSDPEVLTSPERVVPALEGLSVEAAEVLERPVQTEEGERAALDTLVRAHRPRP